MAFSVEAVKGGIRLDLVVAYDESKMTDDQRTMMSATDSGDDLGRIPDNALAFVRGQRLDLSWSVYRHSMTSMTSGFDFDQQMAQIEKQIGINPDTDIFPYLSGDWSLMFVPDKNGFLAQSGTNLGFALMSNTSSEDKLKETIATLNGHLQTLNNNMLTMSTSQIAGIDATTLSMTSEAGEVPVVVYGVGQGHLTIASSQQVFEDLNNGGPSIADADLYKQAWTGGPSGFSLIEYIDVQGLYNLLTTPALRNELEGTGNFLKPIRTVAAGSKALGGGIYQEVVLVSIIE